MAELRDMITDKILFAHVRSKGLTIRKLDGEYRVRVPGNPNADYFTKDRLDAFDTANAMRRELDNA